MLALFLALSLNPLGLFHAHREQPAPPAPIVAAAAEPTPSQHSTASRGHTRSGGDSGAAAATVRTQREDLLRWKQYAESIQQQLDAAEAARLAAVASQEAALKSQKGVEEQLEHTKTELTSVQVVNEDLRHSVAQQQKELADEKTGRAWDRIKAWFAFPMAILVGIILDRFLLGPLIKVIGWGAQVAAHAAV